MKKLKYIIILLIFSFSLMSCSFQNEDEDIKITYENRTTDDFVIPESDNPDGYKITYIGNNDYVYYSTSTKEGKAINPGSPYKICADFLGWYKDKDCTELYNFNQTVRSDLTLYAGWEIDTIKLTNEIYNSTIKANVLVTSKGYKSTTMSQGSGTIFFDDGTYYYVLTNNHVVYGEDYRLMQYTIYDCYNNGYEAKFVSASADYDLSILKFYKSLVPNDKNLNVLDICQFDLEKNDICISMGNPEGLINTISIGFVEKIAMYSAEKSTAYLNNISFDVVYNSAYIKPGSSGGALLDSNLKIAGIQFASAVNLQNEYVRSYAVPATKITEYVKSVFN